MIRLTTENPTGNKICTPGEIIKLGVLLAAQTVAAILTRHGLGPAPSIALT